MLLISLKDYENTVKNVIKVSLTQNQYDALVSFCFNLGSLKDLAQKINNDIITAEDFTRYVFAGGKKIKGLQNRRIKESQLYFK